MIRLLVHEQFQSSPIAVSAPPRDWSPPLFETAQLSSAVRQIKRSPRPGQRSRPVGSSGRQSSAASHASTTRQGERQLRFSPINPEITYEFVNGYTFVTLEIKGIKRNNFIDANEVIGFKNFLNFSAGYSIE